MTTKLKIDLSQGLLEVEGSESFVRTIYSDFKTHFAGIDQETDDTKKTRRSRTTKATAKPKTAPPAKKSTRQTKMTATPEKTPASKPQTPSPAPTYTYIEGLDLGAANDHPSLAEFMDAKFPITNEERNIVFLYFLQDTLKLDAVTPDHIYTCYRAVKFRAPLNIENTLNRREWIEIGKNGNLTLTTAGKNYVEKQLPKKVKH